MFLLGVVHMGLLAIPVLVRAPGPTAPVTLKLRPKLAHSYRYKARRQFTPMGSHADPPFEPRERVTVNYLKRGKALAMDFYKDDWHIWSPNYNERAQQQLVELSEVDGTALVTRNNVVLELDEREDRFPNTVEVSLIPFPVKPVRVGATWDERGNLTKKSKSILYKLTGYSAIGPNATAVVESSYMESLDLDIRSKPRTWVRLADGIVMRHRSRYQITISHRRIDIKMEMDLVP
ncbi:MAG: hypothetical protein JST40_01765 [Armatimonadetes bacterium]|nr:hypothetical protein [Armatimonadota bacterium]